MGDFFASVGSRLTVPIQLAFNLKTPNMVISDAINSDSPHPIAVLAKRPNIPLDLENALGLALERKSSRVFKFLAGLMGEERFYKATYKEKPLAATLIRFGTIDMLKGLAELKFNLHAPVDDGRTLSYFALEEGKMEAFKFLLEAIAKIHKEKGEITSEHPLDQAFNDNPTLLEAAVLAKKVGVVKLLLDAGASPNPPLEDHSGFKRIERMRRSKEQKKSYIHIAIEQQNQEILDLLMNAGANLTEENVSLLDVAMSCEDMALAKKLAKKMGPDLVNAAKDAMGNSMLNKAIINGNMPMAEFFIALPGANVNQFNFKSVTPICEAASRQRADLLELLMKNGAELNAPVNPQKQSLIHITVLEKNYRVTEWLLNRKDFNPNAVDVNGQTALDLAILSQDMRLIEMVLNSDATDVNNGARGTGTSGAVAGRRPPLILALQLVRDCGTVPEMMKFTDVAMLLIDLGANVNAQDFEGTTGLHIMAQELHAIKSQYGSRAARVPYAQRLMRALAKAKANPEIANDQGQKPVDMAGAGQLDFCGLFSTGDIQISAPEQKVTETQLRATGFVRDLPAAPPEGGNPRDSVRVRQTGIMSPLSGPSTQSGTFPRPDNPNASTRRPKFKF